MTDKQPLLPEAHFYLSQPLSELGNYWLELHCCCFTFYPLGLLYRRHPIDVPLGQVLDRLRCKQCGKPTKAVYLTDSPQRGYAGECDAHYMRLWLPIGTGNSN